MIENEIKYVLEIASLDDIQKYCGDGTLIHQGYLPGRGRIRAKVGKKKCEHMFAYKIPVNGMTFELEKGITGHEFELLWPLSEVKLTKSRFTTKIGEVQWDIDFFLRNEAYDFALAEAEMPETMTEPPKLPKFIREHLIYAVPRAETDLFSSRKLADDDYRNEMARKYVRALSALPT